MLKPGLAMIVCSALVAWGCGGDSTSNGDSTGGTSAGGAGGGGTSAGGSPTGGSAGVGTGGGGVGGSLGPVGRCSDAVPAGAAQASDPPAYAGTCPKLVAGSNTIQSSGNQRAFVLALPANLTATEKPPIVF